LSLRHLLVNGGEHNQRITVELPLMLQFFGGCSAIGIRHSFHLVNCIWFLFLLLVVFALDVPQQMFMSSTEHRVLKCILLVLLPRFVKVIHVELCNPNGTCLTKDV
jgi:hypothetical protein